MENFLESYLVKLGFKTDEPSFNRLTSVMDMAEHSVTVHTGGIVKRIIEAQAGIVGVFTSISAAIISNVDRVAMADQSYRLLGLRFLMTTESARKMDIITRTLGATMEEILVDRELHERANVLSADFDRMGKNLPGGFEGGMRSVRDLRAEVGRLGVGVEFLGMHFAYDLWSKVSPGLAGKNFHDWVTEMQDRVPEFADTLTGYAVPALKGTWKMIQELGEVSKETAALFSTLVGLFSGDASIQGATFSFDKLAKAIGHVAKDMEIFVGSVTDAEKVLVHFATGASLLLGRHWAEARGEFSAALKDLNAGSGSILGAAAGGGSGPVIGGIIGGALGGPPGALAGAAAGAAVGPVLGAGVGAVAGKVNEDPRKAQAVAVSAAGGFVSYAENVGTDFLHWVADITGDKKLDATASRLEHRTSGPQAVQASPPPVAPVPALQVQPPAGNIVYSVKEGLIEKLERYIALRENAKPELNNPGNLRNWGATPTEGGFAKFGDLVSGWDALDKQTKKNIYERGLTLDEFFAGKAGVYDGYAPKGDGRNDPHGYAADAAKELGVDVNVPLSRLIRMWDQPQAQPQVVGPQAMPAAPPAPNAGAQDRPPLSYFNLPKAAPPLWLAPPAADSEPRSNSIIDYAPTVASNHSVMDWDWAGILAYLHAPVLPAPNTTTSEVRQTVTVSMGGIYITQPNASAQDIGRVVEEKVRAALHDEYLSDMSQLNPAYG